MNWNQSRELLRGRLFAKYDAKEAKDYDTFVGTLTAEDEDAYLTDILEAVSVLPGHKVLDVGAGSGALTKILSRPEGVSLHALEPSVAMCELLRAKPALAGVKTVLGGCDRKSDKDHFAASSFDAIVSRQVVNSLFDPLVAFQNWFEWLKPGGKAVVIDGIYGRDGWTGIWAEEVDAIPLSACQSMATIPYLMESIGFQVDSVGWMNHANQLTSTRTKRYMVVATKPLSS
jgi:SAM-dependent methyltransferase